MSAPLSASVEIPAITATKVVTPMAIEGEVDKLCNTLVSGIDGLNKKVAEANSMFADTMKEAHDTVDVVVQQGHTLKGALAKLRASIGMSTNGGPPLDGGSQDA
jgi:hypothetical protein